MNRSSEHLALKDCLTRRLLFFQIPSKIGSFRTYNAGFQHCRCFIVANLVPKSNGLKLKAHNTSNRRDYENELNSHEQK
jgi:hypothetical protein